MTARQKFDGKSEIKDELFGNFEIVLNILNIKTQCFICPQSVLPRYDDDACITANLVKVDPKRVLMEFLSFLVKGTKSDSCLTSDENLKYFRNRSLFDILDGFEKWQSPYLMNDLKSHSVISRVLFSIGGLALHFHSVV